MAVILSIVQNYLDVVMLVLLVAAGLFLSIKTRFFQFRKFGYAIKNTVGSLFTKDAHKKDASGVSPFQAVATAMAGTIGTGSIAGIATAITMGGPGAVFWMWISALLGMVTKYSEIVLSLNYREKNENGEWVGGPMYYLRNGLKIKWLAATFAIFAMIACLGTGNATQSNAIAESLRETLGIEMWITGLVLTVLVAAVILGGIRRIASINEKMVPFMAMFFVICACIALVMNYKKIPDAFALIFKEAFNFQSAAGGVAGYGIMAAMKSGFSRGVFSNEAGLGSAPIAHAASSTKDPVKQGLWGVFEVFFTTIIICTVSALIILTTGLYGNGVDGAALSIMSFDKIIPGVGSVVVTLSTIFFALSTILGWAYYGETAISYLTKNSSAAKLGYKLFYVAVVFVGAIAPLQEVWAVAGIMNTLMAVPNLVGLIGLSGVVVKLSKDHFNKNNLE